MMRAPSFLAALFGAALMASGASATAQEYIATHSSGDMSMSADGTNIAFTVIGMRASDFVIFNTQTQRSVIVRGPLSHIGDLGWSPDGDELTFITATNHTLGGEGRHVWRLHPGATEPTIELLALIPYVRSPVLSADGQRLATFEGVVIGDERPWNLRPAYALFERSTLDGAAVRRSDGQFLLAAELYYDRSGGLYTRTNNPVFVVQGTYGYSWQDRDEAGRWSYQWLRGVNSFSFRVLPGENLPAWPQSFPSNDTSGGSLVRPLDDGRVALYSSTNPHGAADWYDDNGMPRRPDRRAIYNIVAFGADGSQEMLVADPLPEGSGRTGGQDISSDGRLFAHVIRRTAEIRPGDLSGHTLMVFENGALRIERRVIDLIENAPIVTIEPREQPIMPASLEVHRVPVPVTTPPAAHSKT
jgi:hypothetical protein